MTREKETMEIEVTNKADGKKNTLILPVENETLHKMIGLVTNDGKDDYIISNEFNGIEFFDFHIMKDDNLCELNEFLRHLNECDEYEHDLIMALISGGEISRLDDVYELSLDDYKLEYDLHTYEDVGRHFYEMNYGEIEPILEEYFDFKKYGKDIMDYDFYSYFCNKGVVFCL